LTRTFCDLGMSPLANSYLTRDALSQPETFYPLHVYVCDACFLVQLPAAVAPEAIFSDYAYFSSYSESWLAHARKFALDAMQRLGLGNGSLVLEVASNDGYLLRNFAERGIGVLGVEPAANVAAAAEAHGVPTMVRFFNSELAQELADTGQLADLLIANNVLAHVPELNDFVAGAARVLKPDGVMTVEFPHVLRLMQGNQFDTIYHEHFSYFSLLSAAPVFSAAGLRIFHVEELATHGGSLRVHACRATSAGHPAQSSVARLGELERAAGLTELATYDSFGHGVAGAKRALLSFLIGARESGKVIAAYGAAAKGNTLLNYCGIRGDFIDYVVDRNPAKTGRYLPGSHIPVFPPERIFETRPDYVLILPWNLTAEIAAQMHAVRQWGGRFVVPIPSVKVVP
jgi:SAM-dependent methyltransferase